MIEEYQIRVLPEVASSEQGIKRFLLEEKGVEVTAVRVLKRSIDARQRTIFVNLKVRAYVNELPEDDIRMWWGVLKPLWWVLVLVVCLRRFG